MVCLPVLRVRVIVRPSCGWMKLENPQMRKPVSDAGFSMVGTGVLSPGAGGLKGMI
jgi:hypothetical protein